MRFHRFSGLEDRLRLLECLLELRERESFEDLSEGLGARLPDESFLERFLSLEGLRERSFPAE